MNPEFKIFGKNLIPKWATELEFLHTLELGLLIVIDNYAIQNP